MGIKSLLPFTYITSASSFPESHGGSTCQPLTIFPCCPSLSLFFHPTIAAASQPRPPRITPQAGVLRQTADSPLSPETQREGTDQEAKLGPCMGRGRLQRPGAGSPSSGGNTAPCLVQVFDTITSYLPRADIQLFLGPQFKTNCQSGGLVKEMSVLSSEGLKLI